MFEQPPLFDDLPPVLEQGSEPIPVQEPVVKPTGNPCVAIYGAGPFNECCAGCARLVGLCKAKIVYKCRLRASKNSPGGDHRQSWPTCGKFEKRTGDIPLYDGRY